MLSIFLSSLSMPQFSGSIRTGSIAAHVALRGLNRGMGQYNIHIGHQSLTTLNTLNFRNKYFYKYHFHIR